MRRRWTALGFVVIGLMVDGLIPGSPAIAGAAPEQRDGRERGLCCTGVDFFFFKFMNCLEMIS